MMYPRPYLGRNLLRDDGLIFVSIDDFEYQRLKEVADEIFGAKNFICNFVWEKSRKNDAKLVSVGHEYVLLYAKDKEFLAEKKTVWREEKPGSREIWEKYLELRKEHKENNKKIQDELTDWFTAAKDTAFCRD